MGGAAMVLDWFKLNGRYGSYDVDGGVSTQSSRKTIIIITTRQHPSKNSENIYINILCKMKFLKIRV